MSQILPGTYSARCVLPRISEQMFTTSNSGKDGIVLDFVLADGREISTTLWLSPAAYNKTMEVLETVFKFDGDFAALARGEGFPNYDCSLVIENEEFQGRNGQTRTTAKVKWINSRAGGRAPANVKGVLGRLAQLSGGKFQHPADSAGEPSGPIAEGMGDDDIPF